MTTDTIPAESKPKKLNRAKSVSEVLNYKPQELNFSGEWREALGLPELSGSILIYGNPKNGKTSFALQLCKYLTRFGRVAYDSIEEGLSLSMKNAIIRERMEDVSKHFTILDKEPVSDLVERLKKRKSPDFIVIDSVQFAEMTFSEYKALKEGFRNKLFIFISHVEGKQPDGRVARKIKRDAGIFVWVEGYKAFASGRYGGGKPYVIWNDGAQKYYEV